MSDEIEDYENQLKETLSEIRQCIAAASKLSGRLKLDKLDYCKDRLGSARHKLKSISIAMREIERTEAATVEQRVKQYDADITSLNQELSWLRTSAENDEALNTTGLKRQDPNIMGAKELTNAAKEIQQASIASTARTKQKIQETIDIGANTNAKLKEQGQQLDRVDKQLDVLDSNLVRAGRQIRVFARRMATDKLILVMILLVLLSIITLIVLRIPAVQNQIKNVGNLANSITGNTNSGSSGQSSTTHV